MTSNLDYAYIIAHYMGNVNTFLKNNFKNSSLPQTTKPIVLTIGKEYNITIINKTRATAPYFV